MSEQKPSPVELNAQHLDSVQVESAVLNQSSAQRVDAGSLIAYTSPIGAAQTETLSMEGSAAGTLQTEKADLRQSLVGGALADDVSMHLVGAGAVLARNKVQMVMTAAQLIASGGDAQIANSVSGMTLVGGSAKVSNTYSVFLIAGGKIEAEGQIRTVFDPESARNFGLAFGAVVGLFWLLRALLRR